MDQLAGVKTESSVGMFATYFTVKNSIHMLMSIWQL